MFTLRSDYLLCEVARSLAVKLVVMFVCVNCKKEKGLGCYVFVCFSMLCMKLAKLLRQTVKFLANEESVTDADSNVCPLK